MEKSHVVYSRRTKVLRALLFLILLVIALVTLYPVIYIILGSFKENNELLLGGTNLLPKKFIFDNYKQAWEKANFANYTVNSLIISLGVMFLSITVTTMAGYVFARKNFKGKELLYSLFVAFMFVNVGSVSLRPLFELAVKVKMNQSLISIILISAGMGQATYIFLVRGYMNTLSKEIDEAAKIDGCTFFQIYYKIIFPLLKPVIATIGLLSFRTGWNEYIMPLVFTMSNDKLRPLTVGVVMLKNSGDGTAAWNLMFAGSTISIIPIIVLYMFTSRYFMSGLTAGAVKG
ncbi:carbohydrate ABC transporter permease [Clostridium sp. Marseille-P299]|uniref:carbohydrate ABC transporter permease n=1 Tax=Clostridium sp. Marseille-P299 TaxID=1805477 RepID=UPI00082AFD11|nr:carbohydrate ABC transporter permease [Clostridium sp. Marseille-P299]